MRISMKSSKGIMIGGIIAIIFLAVSVGAVDTQALNLEGNWTVVTNMGQSSLSDYVDTSAIGVSTITIVIHMSSV